MSLKKVISREYQGPFEYFRSHFDIVGALRDRGFSPPPFKPPPGYTIVVYTARDENVNLNAFFHSILNTEFDWSYQFSIPLFELIFLDSRFEDLPFFFRRTVISSIPFSTVLTDYQFLEYPKFYFYAIPQLMEGDSLLASIDSDGTLFRTFLASLEQTKRFYTVDLYPSCGYLDPTRTEQVQLEVFGISSKNQANIESFDEDVVMHCGTPTDIRTFVSLLDAIVFETAQNTENDVLPSDLPNEEQPLDPTSTAFLASHLDTHHKDLSSRFKHPVPEFQFDNDEFSLIVETGVIESFLQTPVYKDFCPTAVPPSSFPLLKRIGFQGFVQDKVLYLQMPHIYSMLGVLTCHIGGKTEWLNPSSYLLSCVIKFVILSCEFFDSFQSLCSALSQYWFEKGRKINETLRVKRPPDMRSFSTLFSSLQKSADPRLMSMLEFDGVTYQRAESNFYESYCQALKWAQSLGVESTVDQQYRSLGPYTPYQSHLSFVNFARSRIS